MLKRISYFWGAVLCSVSILSAIFWVPECHSKSQDMVYMQVGGASTGTAIYGSCVALAEILNRTVPNVKLVVVASSGTMSHYEMIKRGDIQLGGGSAPGDLSALTGGKPLGAKYPEVTSLFPLNSNRVNIFCLEKKPITKMSDLNGKKVAVGAKGSPTSRDAAAMLKAAGVKAKLIYSTPSEMVEMVKDDRVDACLYLVGTPYSGVLDIASTKKVRMIPMTPDEQSRIHELLPYETPSYITEKMYPWITEPIASMSGYGTFIASRDISEEIIYALVKAAWENWPELVKAAPPTGSVSIEDIPNMILPLHPGAYKYYQEQGIMIPDRLNPPK